MNAEAVARPGSRIASSAIGAPFHKASHASVVRQLSKLQPVRTLGAIALDWAVLIGVAMLALHAMPSWLWPIAWLVIATRQHALLVLMHDAAHGAIVRNRRWNDAIGDLLCGWPLLVSTAAYRLTHLRHHRFVNTADDPDLARRLHGDGGDACLRRQPRRAIAMRLLGLVFGRGLFEMVSKVVRFQKQSRSGSAASPGARHTRWRWLYYTVAAAVITAGSGWTTVLLFWFVPMLTFLPALLHLRGLAEHFGLPWNHELTQSRSVAAGALQRFLFAPHHGGLHVEHHLYPSVPWYHLPRLRAALLADPVFAATAAHADGYLWGTNTPLDDIAERQPEVA